MDDFGLNKPQKHKNRYINSTYEEDYNDNGLFVRRNEEDSCYQNNAVFIDIQNVMPYYKNLFIVLYKPLFT